MVLFTLETRYSFDFFYKLVTEMGRVGVTEIPDMFNRLMSTAGSYKYSSCLPDICPDFVYDNDRYVRYPMVLQRQRFVGQIVNLPKGSLDDICKNN